MKKGTLYAMAALMMACSCKNNQDLNNQVSISPEAGSTYPAGKTVEVKVSFPSALKVDSVVYKMDSVRIGSTKDSGAVSIKTEGMPLGSKTITAQLYEGGKPQEISTNITLLAAQAPEEYTYQIEK